MACYHPLKGWCIGQTKNGKSKIKVTSYNVAALAQHVDGSIELLQQSDFDKSKYNPKYTRIFVDDSSYVTIPCGKCIGCRLEQSRQWANRCLLEMRYHDENYFITITYNDDHLPTGTGIHPSTGEIIETHSLVKKDFQLFMKRLRKEYAKINPKAEKLRFFCAGEYGDHTARPHYHAIIFGLHLDDLVFYKRSGKYNLFTSEFLQRLWTDVDADEYDKLSMKEKEKHKRGFIVVAPATWETAAYTARYCTSKLTGPESHVYYDLNVIPPFTLMSRKPGIGYKYLEDHLEGVMNNDLIYISTEMGSRSCHPPKYYKRKFDDFFEEDDIVYIEQKDLRKLKARSEMEEAAKIMMDLTDNSYLEMLASEEENLKARTKSLERNQI